MLKSIPDAPAPRPHGLHVVPSNSNQPPALDYLKVRVDRAIVSIPRVGDGALSSALFAQASPADAALILAILEAAVTGSANRVVTSIARRLAGPGLLSLDLSALGASLDSRLAVWARRPLDERGYPVLLLYSLPVAVDGTRMARSYVAVGVNREGFREILGTHASSEDTESGWHSFFASLQDRRLRGVHLVVAEDGPGLHSVLPQAFPQARWQQCQAQVQEAVLARAPLDIQHDLHTHLRACFNARSPQTARTAFDRLRETYGGRAPSAVRYLDETFEQATTVLGLPGAHRLRTVRGLSPLAMALRHRQAVVQTFPSLASLTRLMTGVGMELDSDWNRAARYVSLSGFIGAQ